MNKVIKFNYPMPKKLKEAIDNKRVKEWEIWMEGFVATGEASGAILLGKYRARDFDQAVALYNAECIKKHGEPSAFINERKRYTSLEAFNNRRSDYSVWGCNLFDNEADARKSFG